MCPVRHPRIEASPCCRPCSATAEFVVVNLITEQNPEADAELACSRHPSFAYTFLLEFPSIKSLQPVILPRRVHGRFAPYKSEEPISLFREPPEALTAAARVFAGNQANVARDGFAIGKPRRIAKKYFGGECGDRAHAWMRHQSMRLWSRSGFGADARGQRLDVAL